MDDFHKVYYVLQWVYKWEEDDIGIKGYDNPVVMMIFHGWGIMEVQQCQHRLIMGEMLRASKQIHRAEWWTLVKKVLFLLVFENITTINGINKKHVYYFQIHGQMSIAECDYCLFV